MLKMFRDEELWRRVLEIEGNIVFVVSDISKVKNKLDHIEIENRICLICGKGSKGKVDVYHMEEVKEYVNDYPSYDSYDKTIGYVHPCCRRGTKYDRRKKG